MSGLLILAFMFCGILCGAGCRQQPATRESKGLSLQETESQWNEQLLQYAVKNLQRLDEFQGGEMRQQVIDRLNQWIRRKKAPDTWRVDPLIETLPRRLRDIPEVKDLGTLQFTRQDGFDSQQDVWLRDISNWARGSRLEDMARAKNLFDWTVRNIQIEEDDFGPAPDLPQWPWETLLLGRGTAVDRAWVFTLLARQQGIDAILLALPAGKGEKNGAVDAANAADADDAKKTSKLKIWAVGVLDQGKIYLFDPELGLPIPAVDGVRFADGQLDVQTATLAEAAENDGLLRRLDVDKEKPYPVNAARLAGVVGLVAASPASLSARMAMFEEKLSGDERVVLTDNPSDVARRFKDAGRLAEIRLWQRPFELIQKRGAISDLQQAALDEIMSPFMAGGEHPLWRGRTLYFKGVFSGDESATYYYQKARPSNRNLVALRNDLLKETKLPQQVDSRIGSYRRAKQDATYWLGLMASLNGDVSVAEDYLLQRTLEDDPGGPWTRGAKYNLARTYESAGKLKKAAALLAADTDSPGHWGNMLRAKWLEAQLAAERVKVKQEQEAEELKLPGLQELTP